MARKLFGTDGIRGVAGEFPLDPVTVYCVGAALGGFLSAASSAPEVIVGVDTRESGPALAGYLAGGLAAAGARVRI